MWKGKTNDKSARLKEYCIYNQATKRQQQKRPPSHHHNRGLPKMNVTQKVGTWKEGGGETNKVALLFGKCYLVQKQQDRGTLETDAHKTGNVKEERTTSLQTKVSIGLSEKKNSNFQETREQKTASAKDIHVFSTRNYSFFFFQPNEVPETLKKRKTAEQ